MSSDLPLPAPASDAVRSSSPSRTDLARKRLGQMLNDKWHLDELLGVGGMAAVYAATHRNGSRVAIKLLPFSLATGPEVCQRLLREGYLANRIAHPAVVRVLDDHIDYEREFAYLVMDLLHGETARQRFDAQGTFEPVAALELMIELTDCLKAAHQANIIHRDIKPENLFLTEHGLKVLDFGIARALDGNSSLTQTGTSLGTPAYMSPEQARGKQAELSIKSDIYSVGATLFFLLTGETLHQGENPMELMVKVAWTPAPSAATLCPSLPAEIVEIVDRCCAFDPAARYSDAHALEAALIEACSRLGGAPRQTTPPARWSLAPNTPLGREPAHNSTMDAETIGLSTRPWNSTARLLVALGILFTVALTIRLVQINKGREPSARTSSPPQAVQAQLEPVRAEFPEPARNSAPTPIEINAAAVASSPVPRPQVDASGSPFASAPAFAAAPSVDLAKPNHPPKPHKTSLTDSSAVKPTSASFDQAHGDVAVAPPPAPESTSKKKLGPLRYDSFRDAPASTAP